MMKGKMIAAGIAVALVISASPAEASERKQNRKKQQQGIVMTMPQLMRILTMISEGRSPQEAVAGRPGSPGLPGAAGEKGEQGAQGAAGASGERGAAGAAGKDGEAGRDGLDGRDGQDGKDGVGFSPGTIFLVNGACPEGTTIQGSQNRWTVYANDTSGRPWTTTGSSAQLFLSACQVN